MNWVGVGCIGMLASALMIGMPAGSASAAPAAASSASLPSIQPIAGRPDLLIGNYRPEDVGYTAQEYVISGEATSYTLGGREPPRDGRWNATPAAKAPYSTRIVVMVPQDPKRFNGAVIVEWLNVSGGVDSPAVWLMAHRQMTRAGYAYVAVSAQKVGVEGGPSVMGPDYSLKKLNPQRYGALKHPGDAFAYDIYSQVGRLVRAARPGGLLGPLQASNVVAVGESQSATFLTTYVNAVDPLAKVYDGFLVHSRFGAVSRLDGGMDLGARNQRVPGVMFRPDLRVPVLTFITECDLAGVPGVVGYYTARQPDNQRLRVWELAGASHADNYTIRVSMIDTGSAPVSALAAAYQPTTSILGRPVEKPINWGPQQHYVVQSALASLERWISTGEAPVTSPRIELAAGSTGVVALDGNGIGQGGIRTPWTDVPTARLSSEGNAGNLMAVIFGTSEQFSPAKLQGLYPGGKAEYVKRFSASLDRTIAQGFVLAADKAEILGLADASYPIN